MKDFPLVKDKPCISVIVPIYKAEKSICRCVDSILNQTFTDFELILVDDGSPDGCGTICDDYASKDVRVKTIHKSNGGVSSARQAGTDVAKGVYSIHVDADDWIEATMLEYLYQTAIAKDADMVVCDYILELPHKTKYIRQCPPSLSAEFLLRQYLSGTFHAALWNKLIKTSCYRQTDFPKGINYGEDLFVVGNMLHCGSIINVAYVGKAFYHYDNTCSCNITGQLTGSILDAQINLTDYFVQHFDNGKYERELKTLCIGAKRMALELGIYGKKEFMTLYEQVNSDLKIERGYMRFFPSLCLYMAVRGAYKQGVIFLRLWNYLTRVIVRLLSERRICR